MKIVKYQDLDYEKFLENIELDNINSVNEIIFQVKSQGDKALIELSKKYGDGDFLSSNDFIVSDNEIKRAYEKIKPEIKNALEIAIENVRKFAKA